MEHKEAIDILNALSSKYPLEAGEKEAISIAIGVLSWTSLSESRRKAQKNKRDKGTRWYI